MRLNWPVAVVMLGALLVDAIIVQAKEGIDESFTVGKAGRPVFVPITWENENYTFLVDTGADLTVFHETLRQRLGTCLGTVELRGPHGLIAAPKFACPAAKVGQQDLQQVGTIICADLSAAFKATGEQFDGILGMDFLRRYAFELDFDRGSFSLCRSMPAAWREGSRLELLRAVQNGGGGGVSGRLKLAARKWCSSAKWQDGASAPILPRFAGRPRSAIRYGVLERGSSAGADERVESARRL